MRARVNESQLNMVHWLLLFGLAAGAVASGVTLENPAVEGDRVGKLSDRPIIKDAVDIALKTAASADAKADAMEKAATASGMADDHPKAAAQEENIAAAPSSSSSTADDTESAKTETATRPRDVMANMAQLCKLCKVAKLRAKAAMLQHSANGGCVKADIASTGDICHASDKVKTKLGRKLKRKLNRVRKQQTALEEELAAAGVDVDGQLGDVAGYAKWASERRRAKEDFKKMARGVRSELTNTWARVKDAYRNAAMGGHMAMDAAVSQSRAKLATLEQQLQEERAKLARLEEKPKQRDQK